MGPRGQQCRQLAGWQVGRPARHVELTMLVHEIVNTYPPLHPPYPQINREGFCLCINLDLLAVFSKLFTCCLKYCGKASPGSGIVTLKSRKYEG